MCRNRNSSRPYWSTVMTKTRHERAARDMARTKPAARKTARSRRIELLAGSPSAADRTAAILDQLRANGDPRNVEGMARYGIHSSCAYGVPAPILYRIARGIPRDHDVAAALWASGVHEGRAIAALVEEVDRVDGAQMERWARDFDSWAVCDHVCGKLFDRTPLAWQKARAWTRRRPEFVKRAGFVLMAWLAVHDKRAPDERFLACLPLVEREAHDGRNFVKKAVNWALRQIGKRNASLNSAATACARRIHDQGTPSARWIASDALRDLEAWRTRGSRQ